MKQSYEQLLRSLGAEDTEFPHLLACDKCDVDYEDDSAFLWRCARNPVEQARQRHLREIDKGWCLMHAFGLCRPPGLGMDALARIMHEYYLPQLVEQLRVPMLFGLLT